MILKIEVLPIFIGMMPRAFRRRLRRYRTVVERLMAYAAHANLGAFRRKPPRREFIVSGQARSGGPRARSPNEICRRVYHYHVRKTAGTSLNSAFWALAGLSLCDMGTRSRVRRDGLVFVRHDRQLIEEGDYFFANSHLPAYSLRLPAGTFTITILRNPLDRVFSYYRYLLWAREHPNDRHSEPFIRSLKNEISWLGGSFTDFLDRIPTRRLLQQLYMFSENGDIDEAAERILGCSAVFFTETFRQDLERLSKTLALPLQERHERRFEMAFDVSDYDQRKARKLLEPESALVERVRRRQLQVSHGIADVYELG